MALAVALGAFGAHGLKASLSTDALGQWHTGVEYHFLHALALLGLYAIDGRLSKRVLRVVSMLFLAGVLLFSGSLYLLATRDLLGTQSLGPVLGPLTPIGGLCFIAGWIGLLITALRKNGQR